ncbi:MAG: hypothetical protein JWQ81_6678 [Amycolatopsis sp.]|uniref:hypothetical protein n=1 Tax=Amycolatopsis sp. TaxID=37632 RepID=UPI00262718A3|nr:hypothetical protein [Amycolatopsis sp.]MCU1685939.1 hypothetical protein [Amycolatopsis sp.]
MAGLGRDLHLSEGQWKPYDVAADTPTDAGVGTDPTTQGWRSFLHLGSEESGGFCIDVWERSHPVTHPGYLIAISGEQSSSPYLKVDTLPAVMDLLAKWAPVVQASTISRVVRDLTDPTYTHDGIVETVATRATWAVQNRMQDMKKHRNDWDTDDKEKHRASVIPNGHHRNHLPGPR